MGSGAPAANEQASDERPEESAEYLRRVLDASRSATAVVGVDGTVRYASAGIEELLGAPFFGESVMDWLHPDDVERAAVSLSISADVRGIRYFPMVFRARHADGHYVEVDVVAANVLDDPLLEGLVLSIRAADDRSQFIEPVRALASGATHDAVLEQIIGGMGRGGHALRTTFIASERDQGSGGFGRVHAVRAPGDLVALVEAFVAAPGCEHWSDLAPRELRSVPADDLPGDLRDHLRDAGFGGLRMGAIGVAGRVEALLVSAEPDDLWLDGAWTPSTEDHWFQLLDLASVAFERHRVHTWLVHAATHDPLTGLPNRSHFFEQLERLVKRTSVAVLYLDLDRFKAVNDRRGHAVGDAVLVEVGRRLTATLRPGDLVGRLGGDEFAVAVAADDPEVATGLAHRLVDAVSVPVGLEDGPAEIGLSVGLAHHSSGQSVGALLHDADRALLRAKRTGRGGVVLAT